MWKYNAMMGVVWWGSWQVERARDRPRRRGARLTVQMTPLVFRCRGGGVQGVAWGWVCKGRISRRCWRQPRARRRRRAVAAEKAAEEARGGA